MATAKHFIVGCVILVIVGGIVIVAVVGGIFYLGLTKYADEAEKDGVEFGRHTDQQGCQDEALRRLKKGRRSGDLISSRATEIFINGCFQTSRATPGFCRDAPKEDSFLTVQSWARDRCQREGAPSGDDACVSLFAEVSDDCLGKIKHQ
jgi:hypothetical protein